MAIEAKYKGESIAVVTRMIGDRWTWSVRVGDLPARGDDDTTQATEQDAIDEAMRFAKALIDAG